MALCSDIFFVYTHRNIQNIINLCYVLLLLLGSNPREKINFFFRGYFYQLKRGYCAMDFYTRKQKAIKMVELLLNSDQTIEYIDYQVSKTYGFSRKFVEMHIDKINTIKRQQDAKNAEQ